MNKILFSCYFKVDRHASKKNEKTIRKVGNKRFIGNKDKCDISTKWMLQKLTSERFKQRITTIDCDVNLCCTFYYPYTVYFTKKGVRSLTIGDLSNLYELPQDCLQSVGIIENDTLIVSHNGSSRQPIKSNEYYLKIVITKTEREFNAEEFKTFSLEHKT
jgi:Holliday junction resolvase RusA-like endonuclease